MLLISPLFPQLILGLKVCESQRSQSGQVPESQSQEAKKQASDDFLAGSHGFKRNDVPLFIYLQGRGEMADGVEIGSTHLPELY
jgi:hypothetical protein